MREIKYRICSLSLVVLIIFNMIIFSVSSVFADTETITVSGGEKGLDEANIAEFVYKGFLDCYKTASTHSIGFRGEKKDSGARSAKTPGDPKNVDKLTSQMFYVDSDGDAFRVGEFNNHKKYAQYLNFKSTDVGRIMGSDNIFSDQTVIEVDRRLEDIIGKEKKDGRIWCNESNKTTKANITSEFKKIFGVDNSSLICDGDKFGLFRPKEDEGKKCQEVITDNNIKLVKNTVDGQKYIDKLYNNWKKTSAYAKNVDDVKDPSKTEEKNGSRDYSYELKIFKADCTNQQESLDKVTGGTFNFTIKELDASGNVVEKYPQMKNDQWDKSGRGLFTTYYSNGTPLKCDELAKKINEDFDDYRKTIANAKTDACGTEAVIEKANSIVKEYGAKIDAKIPLTDEEKEEYKVLSDALLNKNFTVDDGQGGKKCLETNKLKIVVDDTSVDDTTSTNGDAKQSYCQENGGFLSWMLCPAIADGAATAGGLLGFITNLTTVHTSIIEQFSKQDSSIYKAWSAFRNIANIGFVVMLLVVVFSQVTNIGISNYNIKKILPKLIITAILVNFSYLIMGVLIDLSQIAGNGIEALIKSVAADGMDANASARASATISTIAGAVTGVAGAAGVGAIALGVIGGPAIILSVVMFIITSLISIFFGFVMLTIRQAAIIMAIVLAPLMMVLYALPNTSAITKKYISTVKALLMLYPMFIFATSAGALASSIIIGTSTDLLMIIVGGLLNVLPYFAIPSLTSKSLAGLGAITGAFDKMRGGALKGASMAGGAIAASEFYKNAKNDYASDKSLNRSLGRLRKYKAIEDAGGKLSTSQRRRQMEAAGVVTKDAKMRAGGSAAAGIALSNYEGAGFAGLQAAAQNELMEAEDKNNMMLFANEGYTPDQMIGMLQDASKADYGLMNDDQKRANDSRIRALTKSLMATKAGKKLFESQIASNGDMRLSNRAFGQIAHAALQTPGLADKYQVMNNQFGSYINGGGDTTDTDVKAGLMGSTFSNGISKTLEDMNSDNLQKITKFEVKKMYESGADTTNLDNAFNTLAAASLKDPNLIADFDGIKQEKVLAAQGKYIDEAQKSTINLRSGGSATVYNPPADFGKYTQIKDASGQIFYTNDRGDIFNASTGKQIKGM